MNELIKLQSQTIDGNAIETVSARELHTFLEVNTKFADWIKNRINEYDFVENQDFISFSENLDKPTGGRPSQEYFITLDMAKELSMVERNDKGKQARRYFIECEKKLKSQIAPQPVQPIGETEDKLRAYAYGMTLLNVDDVSKQAYVANAIEQLTGASVPYRPQLEQKTYSATEIGNQLNVSANKVGRITNAHGLKTSEYGVRVLDKAKGHDKQVETFRYYANTIHIIRAILETE